MMQHKIRLATISDIPTIVSIYNHYVLNSTCTYQEDLDTFDNRKTWLTTRGPEHPVTVLELNGQVIGFAALSKFHQRSAYRQSVENAVYLHPDYQGKGFGKALLTDLIDRARQLRHHTIIALIDSEQPASIALHAKLGFQRAGELQQAGFKFNRWLTVIYMQLML